MYTKPFYIVVHPVASKFAKNLQQALQRLVTNKVYRTSKVREGRSCLVLPRQGLSKLEQMRQYDKNDISAPRYATTPDDVASSGINVWFARHLLNSTNGQGIEEFDLRTTDKIPQAPLYTEYIPKRFEYRFHVLNNKVIDVQEKRKRRGHASERNTRVRNLRNGYVYCRDVVSPPDGAADLAIRAVAACNYLYGAVDIIYNEKRNQVYVLEVNSRPGLMGTTLINYANSVVDLYQLRKK
jgi:hypothetical protein